MAKDSWQLTRELLGPLFILTPIPKIQASWPSEGLI